jgi:FixJ family two-component response regulator
MLAEQSKGEQLVLYIVDADASVRQALCRLASTGGFRARAFASIEQFMTELEPNDKGCLLLDSSLVRAGSALREAVRHRSPAWPVIMLCVGADEAARQEAMDLGADFLLNKPVDAQALFDSIAWVTMRRMDH